VGDRVIARRDTRWLLWKEWRRNLRFERLRLVAVFIMMLDANGYLASYHPPTFHNQEQFFF
jgi:hypothetical protein